MEEGARASCYYSAEKMEETDQVESGKRGPRKRGEKEKRRREEGGSCYYFAECMEDGKGEEEVWEEVCEDEGTGQNLPPASEIREA